MINLDDYKSIPFTLVSFKRKSNIITDVDLYNEIVDYCRSFKREYTLNRNGRLHQTNLMFDGYFFDNPESTNSYSICLIHAGRIYKWTFMPGLLEQSVNPYEEDELTGLDAYKYIKDYCGRELYPFKVSTKDEMAAVKAQIEKAHICMHNTFLIHWSDWNGEHAPVLRGVHHIDIHSAWPAALLRAHPDLPELNKCFNELYENRKKDKKCKFILNAGIGAMQSYKILPGFPILSRDAINGNNAYMNELIAKLKAQGFYVIAENTDGIFYTDLRHPERLYHDENEGDKMGQWRHDHHYIKIRFKSAGAYEYIEYDKEKQKIVYRPVVRGIPLKLSKTFVWGDIFKHHPKIFIREDNGKISTRDIENEYEYLKYYGAGGIYDKSSKESID